MMKGQLDVKTPAEYIAAVDDKRRSEIAALDALIRKHAPKLEPVIMGGMLGYGPFHYRYASGLLRRRRDRLRRRAIRRAAPEGQHRQGLRAVQEARGPRREGACGAHQGDREEWPRLRSEGWRSP